MRVKEEQACFKEEQARFNEEQVRLNQQREHEKVERSVLALLNQGVKAEIISKILDIAMDQIEEIENKYKNNNPILKYLKN